MIAQLPIPTQPGAPPGAPPAEQPDIRDIVPPEPLPDYLHLALVAVLASLAVFLFAFLVILALRALKRRREQPPPPLSPAEVAHAALDDLRSRANALSPNAFALETSNIVKQYFHDRYEDPLLFETSEEFAIRENHKKTIPHSKRVALGDFFEACDTLKFANAPGAATNAGTLLDSATALLQESPIPEATISETQYVTSSRNT